MSSTLGSDLLSRQATSARRDVESQGMPTASSIQLIPNAVSTGMEINHASLSTCGAATGTVVVIDVIRAFTTASYAFAAGASEILLVSTVEEALALRERDPSALIMGEVNGLPVEGFDFGNSPSALIGRDLVGRHLIQRTSAGTQGVVRSTRAESLLASSFTCASATVRYLHRLSPPTITFVITGISPDWDGEEDIACAEYVAALLRSEAPDVAPYIKRVYESQAGRCLTDPAAPAYLRADLECCVATDLFDFAMVVERRDGLLVMQACRP